MMNTQKQLREEFFNATQPLAEGMGRSLDCFKTKKNNNLLLIGPPGSNKTRGLIIPTILSAVGSMIISDPKGSLYNNYSSYLLSKGYKVKKLSFLNPASSAKYNPISSDFIKNTADILKVAYSIIYTKPGSGECSSHIDPFWDQTSQILLSAVIAYVLESSEFKEHEKNLNTVIDVISSIDISSDDLASTEFAERVKKHAENYEKKGKTSFAYKQFLKLLKTPNKTICTIITTTQAAMGPYDNDEIRKLLEGNELDIRGIGSEKTALFIEVSDTDRSLDGLASILYTQLFNELSSFAIECPGEHLPVPVRVILDDFATNVKIPDFQAILSNIRSRLISAILCIQSENQLHEQYPRSAGTLIEDCDTIVYMGVNSLESAHAVASRANISLQKALRMPVGHCYIFEHGCAPVYARSIELDKYMRDNGIVIQPYTKQSASEIIKEQTEIMQETLKQVEKNRVKCEQLNKDIDRLSKLIRNYKGAYYG